MCWGLATAAGTLYFFAGNASADADTQPSDMNGQGIGGVWFVVTNADTVQVSSVYLPLVVR